ncbi:MAG: ATP-dependent helicase [Thermoleophilia bacterium]|nr:ATP-dependent helicase [Thermoleophilia bacterium]
MLASLTPEQAAAVTHPRGPLLVVAGAGAGKTRVLCHRLAWLVDRGAEPSEVLALTFTRQAAEELRHRAEDLLGRSHEGLRVSTFHAWAQQLVRVHGVGEGLAPSVRQVEPERRKLMLLGRLHELDLQLTTGRLDPAQIVDGIVARIDRCRDELVRAADYLSWAREAVASAPNRKAERDARRELEFAQAFAAHDRWLADEGLEDFGMSLVRALELVRAHADIRDAVRASSRHLLVDEFQDTNHAQAELLYAVAHPEGSLAVVGDDAQGIYRFRGASTKNIADFRARYPDAAEVRLERNYRSSQVILDAAWAVVSKVPDRVDKDLRAQRHGPSPAPRLWLAPDPAGQARAVVAEIIRQTEAGVPYEEQAILMRAVRTEAAAVVLALEQAGVPHQVRGGLGLLDRREVRVAMAWLRAVADPADGQALLRVAADPRLGVPWDVAADLVAGAKGSPLRVALTDALGDRAPRLGELLDELGRVAAVEPPPAVLRAVLDVTGLRAEAIAAGGAQAASRLAALAALERMVRSLADESPDADLTAVNRTLWSLAHLGYRGESGTPVERRGVQVMTVHQSKGLEFDAVYVIGLTHRQWPGHDRGRTDIPDALLPEVMPNDPDAHAWEARRLAYVALTRARHTLVLSAVGESAEGTPQRPSRFVDDILADLPSLTLEAVGEDPAAGASDRVGEARETLERATLAAARARADGEGADALDTDARVALEGLVAAQASALRPLRLVAPPAPAAPGDAAVRVAVSSLVRYWRCPLQYRYAHVDRIPGEPGSPVQGLGIAAHHTLERGFPADGPPMDPGQMTALLAAQCDALGLRDTAQARHAIERSRETFPAMVRAHVAKRTQVVAVERPFTLALGAHRVRGRIDRIDRRADGSHALVDYKTGTQPSGAAERDGRDVMRIYMLGADQALGVHAQAATLEYVFEGTSSKENPEQADMDDTLHRTTRTLDDIAAGRFDPTPGWVCRSCDYRLLCPAQDR